MELSLTRSLYNDYIDYIENVLNFSAATVRSYRYVLGKFVNTLKSPLDQITLQDIDMYFKDRLQEVQPSSVNTERSQVRSFLMYVDRYRGYRLAFDYSMIRNIKTEKSKINFLELDEVRNVINHFDNEQDRLIIYTLFATGMRIGEIVRFRVEDFYDTEITVRGKGGKKRVVPIPPDLSEALRDHIDSHHYQTGCVFRHQQTKYCLANQAYTVSGLRKRIQRRLDQFNIHVHPHMFRHSIATTLLRNGMDIRAVQTFLGHEHIATTMRYTHITDNFLRESYNEHYPHRQININAY